MTCAEHTVSVSQKWAWERIFWGHTNCMFETRTLCQKSFNFPRRDWESPHLPRPLSMLPKTILSAPVVCSGCCAHCFWHMLFSGVCWLLLGSSSFCHLELAMASFPILNLSSVTALMQADAVYHLLRFVPPSDRRLCSSHERARPKPNPSRVPFFSWGQHEDIH